MTFSFNSQQDRQCTYNDTQRCFRATIVATQSNIYSIF